MDADSLSRQTDPLDFRVLYAPPRYPGERTGAGSWFTLSSGEQELGVVWTNGTDGIGYDPTTQKGIVSVPAIYVAFSTAAGQKVPAADVFAWWAGQASQGYAAGPVTHGDLDTLG